MSTLKVATIQDTSGNNSSTPAGIASGTAKAWVNFNGSGTVAINASFNCSSITDQGTGEYQFNFTANLTDKNYSVTGSCILGTTAGVNGITHFGGSDETGTTSGSQTSGYFRFGTYPNNSKGDFDYISVTVHR